MTGISILVLSDAGFAGKALLARRDVELRWALSKNEAIAALRRKPYPKLTLARESFALDYLTQAKNEVAAPPCLVLTDGKSLHNPQAYFAAGATVIAADSAEGRVLEAISALTGLPFRQSPRVAYSSVLDIGIGDQHLYLETVDLSTTAVSVRGLPFEFARLGMRAVMAFMLLEPPLTATGIVTRVFEEQAETIAAFAFEVISPQDRARLAAVVEQERQSGPKISDPIDFSQASGQFTLDLHQKLLSDDRAIETFRQMLVERLSHPTLVVRVPSWLERLARSLTDCERAHLLGQNAPAFAQATIDTRICLNRLNIEGRILNHRQGEVAGALDLCRGLTAVAALENPTILADVTLIRAALLREVYGPPARERHEIEQLSDMRTRSETSMMLH